MRNITRTIATLAVAAIVGVTGISTASATGVHYKRPGTTQPIVVVLPDETGGGIGTHTGTVTPGRWTPVAR